MSVSPVSPAGAAEAISEENKARKQRQAEGSEHAPANKVGDAGADMLIVLHVSRSNTETRRTFKSRYGKRGGKGDVHERVHVQIAASVFICRGGKENETVSSEHTHTATSTVR